MERKLAAILAADVAGYGHHMGEDEVGTLRALTRCRDVAAELIARHRGRIANTAGDSVLAEFPSVIEVVECALAMQEAFASGNAADVSGRRLLWRIGINVGDVLVRNGDLFGDGVNIAARLQALAEPGGICVSGTVREQLGERLPVAFVDLGPRAMKNIATTVRVFALGRRDAAPAERQPAAPAVPDKPSIVVLPFENLSADPEHAYLADGLVEEITAALSRVRAFFVIARNSAFTYKGKAALVQDIGRELGVRYVVEGSIRRSGNRVRLTAQLVDAASGHHLWADRYDGTLDDVFDLQDRVTASIVGAIEPSVRAAEIERARRKRPDSLDAYDLLLRALPHVWALDLKANTEALTLLERSLRRDPDYAQALALASWCHGQRYVYQWSTDAEGDRVAGLDLARRAVERDPEDPLVLVVAGTAETLLAPNRDLARARLLLDKALALDPNSALAWQRSGWVHVYDAKPELALRDFAHALRLSPFDPMAFNLQIGIADAHFVAGRFRQAIDEFRKAMAARPDIRWVDRIYVPACVHAGEMDEARTALRRLVAAYPDLTVRKVAQTLRHHPAVLERITAGLRAAGLPE